MFFNLITKIPTLQSNKVRAINSAGLYLVDDADNGIFVKDGGNVGVGFTSPAATLCVNGGVNIGAQTAVGTNGLTVAGTLTLASLTGVVTAAAGVVGASLGTANQILGVNSGATASEFKTVAGTSNRVTVTHGTNSITLSTPQDIHTAATPSFAQITLGADPSAAMQAATKQYVDANSQGLVVHSSCICATTGNITLSGAQTIDGISVVAGNRVLVKNQGMAAANGIYIASNSAWSRAADMSVWADVVKAYVLITSGTANLGTGWATPVAAGGTIDVTAMPWAQFITASTPTAGTGIAVAGYQVSLDTGRTLSLFNSSASDGIIVGNGAAVGVRTLTAGTGISVTNGTGVSGNPTVTLADITQGSGGSFVKITIDGQGRITQNTAVVAGDIPSLSAYYQPLDASLTSIAGLAGTSGKLYKTGVGTYALDTTTYLTGNQTITLTGAVTGSGTTSIATTQTTVALNKGGTGQTTKGPAFNALSPMTTLGDIIYGGASGTGTALAGNTVATRKFLRQLGTGTVSAAPAWDTVTPTDIGLDTWAGSLQITTVGIITTGYWHAAVVDGAYGGTGVANTGKTITLGGNLATSGAYGLTLTLTNTTNITLPTSGALAILDANTFTAKQTFAAPSTSTASILIPNGAADPSAPVSGDLWANTGAMKWYDGSATKTLAFTDSNVTGTATNVTGTVAIANGGTGQTAKAAGFNALSPITTLGDIIYGDGANSNNRLAGSTSATKYFLSQTGTGSVSAAPAWSLVTKSDVGLGSVENTALSTWAGTSNIITVGTITGGTWHGAVVTGTYGGTGVNNGSSTITIGGNVTVSGAYTLGITLSNNTSITLPTAGTLAILGANTFTAKQTLVAPSTSTASILIPNGAADPTAPVSGDVWANAGAFKWYNGSATKTFAFTDSSITGTATNATNVGITDTTTDATHYLTFVSATSGNTPMKIVSTKLTVNPSSGYVGVGSSSNPLELLEVDRVSGSPRILVASWSTTLTHSPTFMGLRSKSITPGTLAQTDPGSYLLSIIAQGVTSASARADAASIKFVQDSAAGATYMPGRIEFHTGTNAADLTRKMILMSDGKFSLGSQTPSCLLDVYAIAGFTENLTPTYNEAIIRGYDNRPTISNKGTLDLEMSGSNAAIDVGCSLTFSSNKWIFGRSYTHVAAAIRSGKETAANQVSTSYLSFYTSDASTLNERMRISSSGNVGIGTTTSTSLLHIAQTTVGVGQVATNGTITLTGSSTQFTSTFKVGDTITVSGDVRTIATIPSDTSLTVTVAFSTTASALSYTLTGGNRFAVKGNGNVGIGTLTGLSTLSINGGLHVGGDSDAGDNNLIVDGDAKIGGYLSLDDNGDFYLTYSASTLDISASSGNINISASSTLTINAATTYIESSVIFNSNKADKDFVAHGDTLDNVMYMDASTNRLGVLTNTPSSAFTVNGDIAIQYTGTGVSSYQYVGGATTDGSWRWYTDGTDLIFERRVSGTWTEKGRIAN